MVGIRQSSPRHWINFRNVSARISPQIETRGLEASWAPLWGLGRVPSRKILSNIRVDRCALMPTLTTLIVIYYKMLKSYRAPTYSICILSFLSPLPLPEKFLVGFAQIRRLVRVRIRRPHHSRCHHHGCANRQGSFHWVFPTKVVSYRLWSLWKYYLRCTCIHWYSIATPIALG